MGEDEGVGEDGRETEGEFWFRLGLTRISRASVMERNETDININISI